MGAIESDVDSVFLRLQPFIADSNRLFLHTFFYRLLRHNPIIITQIDEHLFQRPHEVMMPPGCNHVPDRTTRARLRGQVFH